MYIYGNTEGSTKLWNTTLTASHESNNPVFCGRRNCPITKHVSTLQDVALLLIPFIGIFHAAMANLGACGNYISAILNCSANARKRWVPFPKTASLKKAKFSILLSCGSKMPPIVAKTGKITTVQVFFLKNYHNYNISIFSFCHYVDPQGPPLPAKRAKYRHSACHNHSHLSSWLLLANTCSLDPRST